MEAKKEPDFQHFVQATREIVEEFRDLLSEHTAELQRAKIEINSKGVSLTMPAANDDPQRHAYLHRLRTVCSSTVNRRVTDNLLLRAPGFAGRDLLPTPCNARVCITARL
jgi:hypothetical protein